MQMKLTPYNKQSINKHDLNFVSKAPLRFFDASSYLTMIHGIGRTFELTLCSYFVSQCVFKTKRISEEGFT